MVVLSAVICTKGGKALVARQCIEMTRIRIEGLIAAFPKLMGDNRENKQHTYIETESVRYLYLPLDAMYLLLITNRASNIVEDLETLRLLSKVIPSITGATGSVSEDKIIEKSFDLVFAFDEVLTTGGYRENINLQQIKTNLEMESHEEKLHNMIKLSKMESAKDQAAAAAKAIKDRKKEEARLGLAGSSSTSMGSDNLMSTLSTPSSAAFNSSAAISTPAATPATSTFTSSIPTSKPVAVKGMSLSAGAKSKAFEEALIKEDKITALPTKATIASDSGSNVAAAAPAPVVQHPLMLQATEKVSAKLSRDGLVESFEVKGNLMLTALNDDVANCIIKLNQQKSNNFTFTTHPKMNKALYDKSNVLQLKDTNKGFPSGRPVGILKWTNNNTTSNNEDLVPLKINCWPEEEGRGMMTVSIEYSMDLPQVELHDVKIIIPLGTGSAPSVGSIDGTYRHNSANSELVWEIDLIDSSNTSGSLEFSIAQKDANAFFPIHVQFESRSLYCNMEISDATTVSSNSKIIYGFTKSMTSEEYIVG